MKSAPGLQVTCSFYHTAFKACDGIVLTNSIGLGWWAEVSKLGMHEVYTWWRYWVCVGVQCHGVTSIEPLTLP